MSILRRLGTVLGCFIVTAAVVIAAFLLLIRPAQNRWGATGAEAVRIMPGDQIVAHPVYATTRAVTIKARPEEIWPWLVQIGYKRGGLYSYDWLDRLLGVLDRPSASRVMQEFSILKPGDEIPMGYGPGWPVDSIDPGRWLLLNIQQKGLHVTWFWSLAPLNARATRLILRVRGEMQVKPAMIPLVSLMAVGEFAMVRRMLTGIKQRVEGAAPTPSDELFELFTWAMAVIVGLISLVLAFIRKGWVRFFLLAWASFIAVCFLAMEQPQLWVGILLDFILFVWLMRSLRRPRAAII
jgi:hypothetical protein